MSVLVFFPVRELIVDSYRIRGLLILKSTLNKEMEHCSSNSRFDRAPVAQLNEHRSVTRDVVSSTPAGPSLRVLK